MITSYRHTDNTKSSDKTRQSAIRNEDMQVDKQVTEHVPALQICVDSAWHYCASE